MRLYNRTPIFREFAELIGKTAASLQLWKKAKRVKNPAAVLLIEIYLMDRKYLDMALARLVDEGKDA